MKNILLLILAISLFASCKKEEKTIEIPTALIIGDPLDYGIHNTLIFPVGTSYRAEVYQDVKNNDLQSGNNLYFSKQNQVNFRMADKEFINDQVKDFDIRNILFYDLLTGKTKQLITDTLHILSFAIHKNFSKQLILYRIVKHDINDDKKYDSLDPVMLYVSNINGDSLVQVTPENQHYVNYNFYPKTNSILIKTLIDSDKDKEFTNADETNFLEMKIKAPAFGKEIFSKSLKDSLKNQIKAISISINQIE